MMASASRNFASITTILPRSICWTSPDRSSPTLSVNSSRIRARSPSRTRWLMLYFAACTAVRPNALRGICSSGTSAAWTAGARQDAGAHATQAGDRGLNLASDEAQPVAVPARRPVESRARDLEPVARPHGPTRVEPGFQRAARHRAVVHRHPPRLMRRRPFDAHLNERPSLRAADTEVGQFEAQGSQLSPK